MATLIRAGGLAWFVLCVILPPLLIVPMVILGIGGYTVASGGLLALAFTSIGLSFGLSAHHRSRTQVRHPRS